MTFRAAHDEARQFLAATRGHRLHALFELALHTGLRKGELLGLRWEDLDLDAGAAAIRRTLQRTSAGGLTTLPTKTRASERRIAIPTRCVRSLKLHHEQQQREAAGPAWQHSGHVFTTAQGGAIDPTNLTRAFTTLLRKPASAASASMTSATRPPRCSWNRASNSSSSRNSSATPTSASPPPSTLTSDSASSETPSTPSAPRSTARRSPRRPTATAMNRHPAPPSSADVAVNYCRHPTQKPRQGQPDGASSLLLLPSAIGVASGSGTTPHPPTNAGMAQHSTARS